MILPDVNVLIYAFRKDLPHHRVCHAWLATAISGDARFGLSPMVLSAVVRITTNGRAFRTPSAIEEAFGVLRRRFRATSLRDCGTRRAALEHLQAFVHRNRHARISGH